MNLSPMKAIAAAALASVAVAMTLLAAAQPRSDDPCLGAVTSDVRNGFAVCVHASERPPAGIDLRRTPSNDQLKVRRFGALKQAPSTPAGEPGTAAAASGGSVACIGDGVDGKRVQTIYAHASDVPDRFGSVVGLIRQYAADADYQIDVSAGQSSQGRRIRFVTDSCVLSVASVTLTPAGDDTFTAMRSELQAQGFDRPDRHYLVWMDASVGICGLGELYSDDSPSLDNANNGGPAYARVDAPCWGYAEAHELLHTLGAVQSSAPHSTGAGHCVDENDTMCYSDTSGAAMTNVCPSLPAWQVDCGLDDYFNASPQPASYLGTHWDVADSGYLEGAPAPPAPPSVSVRGPASFYAGNAVAVSAAASVPPGRTYAIRWVSSRTDCGFFRASGSTNTYYCPVTSAGAGQITVRVTDSLGMSSSASVTYRLVLPSRRRATAATIVASRTTIRRGGSSTLTGRLVDAANGRAVIGMKVSIYYRRLGARSWSVLTSRITGRTGTFTLSVRPSRTTYYLAVSWLTRTWASDQSSARRINVS